MNYDDLVLEVAAELDQTSRSDLVSLLERGVEKVSKNEIGPTAGIKHFAFDFADPDFVEVTMVMPVKWVLAGREVDPQDVVRAFATDAGPSQRISIIDIEMEPQARRVLRCFSLVQQHASDSEFFARYKRLLDEINNLPHRTEDDSSPSNGASLSLSRRLRGD